MQEQQELMRELLLKDASTPALSVSWCQQGFIHATAFGRTNEAARNPDVDTNTLFQSSSLSKPVSAAIVLDLLIKHHGAQLGLTLDTPLAEIADGYGSSTLKKDPYYEKVTIRMVIGQCSGLLNLEEAFTATPGSRFTYSGVALNFLKQVLEAKTGQNWETIAQAFFTKVGMKSATFDRPDVDRQVAKGHETDGTLVTLDLLPADLAGSLLITARDYITFLQHCFADDDLKKTLLTDAKLLKPENFPPITSSVDAKIQWGLGMGIYSDSEKTIVFHWGNNKGFTTFCAMDMKTGDCITCFANSDNGPSVFPQIVRPVVGDIAPLFQWLAQYCKFRVESTAQAPEAIADMVYSMTQKSHVEAVHETTHSWKSTRKPQQSQPRYMAPTESSKAKEREKFSSSPLQTTPRKK